MTDFSSYNFSTLPGVSAGAQIIGAALGLGEGQLGGPVETATGAVLFEVVERKVFDPAAFEEAKEETRQGQETQQLNQLMASLVELRRRDLTPTYDPQVFSNFGIELAGAAPGGWCSSRPAARGKRAITAPARPRERSCCSSTPREKTSPPTNSAAGTGKPCFAAATIIFALRSASSIPSG